MQSGTSVTVAEIRISGDGADIIGLAREHARENAPHMEFNSHRVLDLVISVLEDITRKHLNVWIARIDGVPAGFVVGSCERGWCSYDYVAMLDTIYVRPEHRKSRLFLKLMREFEEWARLNGAVQITGNVTLFDEQDAEKVAALFPRIGYTITGRSFVKLTKGSNK